MSSSRSVVPVDRLFLRNTSEPVSDDAMQKLLNVFLEQPSVAIFVGEPKTGKTTCVRSILYMLTKERKHFKGGIVYSPTANFTGDFDFLPDRNVIKVEDGEAIVTDEDGEETKRVDCMEHFYKYCKVLSNRRDKMPKGELLPENFVVFDDMMGFIKFDASKFKSIMCKHRHLSLSVFFVSHYLAKGVSTQVREQTRLACLYGTVFGNSLKLLHQLCGLPIGNQEDFMKLIMHCCEEEYHCLMYIKQRNSKNKYECYYKYKAKLIGKFKVEWDKRKRNINNERLQAALSRTRRR